MDSNRKEVDFIRWVAGLAAGRRGRLVADPPVRNEAKAKLETWRTSREQAKLSEQDEQEAAELNEIAALEAALKTINSLEMERDDPT